MGKRIAVVISQGQSQNPKKRQLEEDLVTQLMFEAGLDVTVVPHLYDLKPDGTGILALRGIKGDFVICSWLYDRAARWILDRAGIQGHEGTSLLESAADEDEEELEEEFAEDDKSRVIESRDLPARKIYCLDLRTHDSTKPYIEEIQRIANEASIKTVDLMGWIQGQPSEKQLDQYLKEPAVDSPVQPSGDVTLESGAGAPDSPAQVVRIDEQAGRRWYPVIDYSRCTNCMECIDFCLFGVYGVDQVDTILVEQPDNCRKGCPACSRVCPENAIIFPQHKTPAIAGAAELAASLKIDLSRLFGAPEEGKSAVDMAVLERDEQLQLAGRDIVGDSVGIANRKEEGSSGPKDKLDDLLDELDSFDL
jgi:NAD-dependent dihydropyrimidine dehydrogenase PreA subunit